MGRTTHNVFLCMNYASFWQARLVPPPSSERWYANTSFYEFQIHREAQYREEGMWGRVGWWTPAKLYMITFPLAKYCLLSFLKTLILLATRGTDAPQSKPFLNLFPSCLYETTLTSISGMSVQLFYDKKWSVPPNKIRQLFLFVTRALLANTRFPINVLIGWAWWLHLAEPDSRA